MRKEDKDIFLMYLHWFYHWCLMNDIPMNKFSDGKEEFKDKFLNYIKIKEENNG